jgi:hypothetical protein
MSEDDRLAGDTDWSDLGCVEREQYPSRPLKWVKRANLQLTGTRSSKYVALDETVIRIGTEC